MTASIENQNKGMTATIENPNKGTTASIEIQIEEWQLLYVNLIENPNKGMTDTLCKLNRESK